MASVEESIGNVVSLNYKHQDPQNILLLSNKVKRSIQTAFTRLVLKWHTLVASGIKFNSVRFCMHNEQ